MTMFEHDFDDSLVSRRDYTQLRMTTCPRELCHRRLLFLDGAKRVHCRICSSVYAVDQLPNATVPASAEAALDLLRERASNLEQMGEMGKTRLRMANRRIDGIGGKFHMAALSGYFERYGVDGTKKVVKLSEMGRSEPINVVTLSDYAFGIRKEHLDVRQYGESFALNAFLSETIGAINDANAIRTADAKALVPLSVKATEWFYNAVMIVSRACVGRELFADRLTDAVSEHVSKYGDHYKRITNYTDAQWSILTYQNPGTSDTRLGAVTSLVDLAVMANVMRRCFLLVDVDQQPTVKVFVPFLRNPEQCVNWRGVARSPIVVAWGDRTRTYKVPMVAMATADDIREVRFPRAWFKTVWGFPKKPDSDALLSKYLAFDSEGNCVVAHGKYFKPEYLREYVTAFDDFNTAVDGVHGTVLADCWADLRLESEAESRVAEIVSLAGQLWRCVQCGVVKVLSDQDVGVECTLCNTKGRNRRQWLDGSIDYKSGDHTMTPAPKSCCFTKRKHFYGQEYDNPPRKIRVRLDVLDISFDETILWFSNESDARLNSNAYEVATYVFTRATNRSFDFESKVFVTRKLEDEILRRVQTESDWEHRREHLEECLVNVAYEDLFDDWIMSVIANLPAVSGHESLNTEARDIVASAKIVYKEFRKKHAEHLEMSGIEPTDDMLLALWETDEALSEVEECIFRSLDGALAEQDDEKRWCTIRAAESLFAEGGLYHTYAKRRFRGQQHFKLPLLGERTFAFSNIEKTIALCVQGAGHFLMRADVEQLAEQFVRPGVKECTFVKQSK